MIQQIKVKNVFSITKTKVFTFSFMNHNLINLKKSMNLFI